MIQAQPKSFTSIYQSPSYFDRKTIFPALYHCNEDVFKFIVGKISLLKTLCKDSHRKARTIRFSFEALKHFEQLDEKTQKEVKPRLMTILQALDLIQYQGVYDSHIKLLQDICTKDKTFFGSILPLFHEKDQLLIKRVINRLSDVELIQQQGMLKRPNSFIAPFAKKSKTNVEEQSQNNNNNNLEPEEHAAVETILNLK